MEADEAPGGDLSLASNRPELGRQLKAGRQDHSERLSRDPGWQVPLSFSTWSSHLWGQGDDPVVPPPISWEERKSRTFLQSIPPTYWQGGSFVWVCMLEVTEGLCLSLATSRELTELIFKKTISNIGNSWWLWQPFWNSSCGRENLLWELA